MAQTAQQDFRTFSPFNVRGQTCFTGGSKPENYPVPTPQPITRSEPLGDARYASKESYGRVQIRSFGQGPEKRTFSELQTFHFYLEETDAEVWCIEGPFDIETHAEGEHNIRSDIDDYLCYLWRTYAESDEPMTEEATRVRKELLQAVSY